MIIAVLPALNQDQLVAHLVHKINAFNIINVNLVVAKLKFFLVIIKPLVDNNSHVVTNAFIVILLAANNVKLGIIYLMGSVIIK